MGPFSLAIATVSATMAIPDGNQLAESETCYTISRDAQPIGLTWQSVRADHEGDTPVWKIVVHQRTNDGSFDLRDEFVLRRVDMRPIQMVSFRSGNEHVRVLYSSDQIETIRPEQDPEIHPTSQLVWDGNLWGLTFAALPLEDGAQFTLPFYQYNSEFGHFSLTVNGSVEFAGRDAWVLEVDPGNGSKTSYYIAKDTHQELGYAGGPMVQSVGGDCSVLAARR